MELHSIQSDLNGITEYNSAIIDPNERQRTIIGDLKVIQKEISSLIETINMIKASLGLKKLEFDVKLIWPVESLKSSCIIEKCDQIESFLNLYDLSFIKIKMKNHSDVPEDKNVPIGKAKGIVLKKQELIQSTPPVQAKENQNSKRVENKKISKNRIFIIKWQFDR